MTRENAQPCREESFPENLWEGEGGTSLLESSYKEHLQVAREYGAHHLAPGRLALPERELAPDKLLRG